jgi:hypothetical protein
MTSRRTGEPVVTTWAVLIASFALSATTWVAIAELAGFTQTLGPFRFAWLMPVTVDGYVVVSLITWMAPVPEQVARFARKNTYAAATVGVIAQSAFHGFLIWTSTGGVVWRTVLAAVAGMLPPAGAALSVHMRALTRRSSATPDVPAPAPAAVPAAALAVVERFDPLGLDGRDDTEPTPEPAGTPDPAPEPVPAASTPKRRPPVPDQRIMRALADPDVVPRRPDGTVAIDELWRRWGVGQERAVRLLKEAKLHRAKEGEPVPEDVDEDVPADRELEDVNA